MFLTFLYMPGLATKQVRAVGELRAAAHHMDLTLDPSAHCTVATAGEKIRGNTTYEKSKTTNNYEQLMNTVVFFVSLSSVPAG